MPSEHSVSLITVQKHTFVTLFTDYGETGTDLIYQSFACYMASFR